MSIDEDLSLLMSRLPEPERLTTGKAATWPSAIHVLVRVLLALREDMRAMKEHDGQAQASRLFPHQEAAFLTIERQRVAGLLSSAFGTVGTIEDQIEAIRCIVAEAQMEARGVRELERQVQHEQARWARIQPLIRALHLWEGADITTAQGQLRMLEAQFEAWQRAEAEAEALNGEEQPPLTTLEVRDPETGAAVKTFGLRRKCDGEHSAPVCEDPQCWRREKAAEVTAPGKASARPAESVTHCSLPEAVHRLVDYIDRFTNRIEEDGGQHGVFRVVLFPDAARRYGVTPGNPMTVRVAAGDVEVTTTGMPLVEIRSPHDPTTASIEASNHAKADLRERLRDYAFEERDRAMAQRDGAIETVQEARTAVSEARAEVTNATKELVALQAEVKRLGDELGTSRDRETDARRERSEALAQRQKLIDDGLAARLLADAMLEAVKPLLPNGCKFDPDSVKVAIADYADAHDNLVRAVKVLAKELQ